LSIEKQVRREKRSKRKGMKGDFEGVQFLALQGGEGKERRKGSGRRSGSVLDFKDPGGWEPLLLFDKPVGIETGRKDVRR